MKAAAKSSEDKQGRCIQPATSRSEERRPFPVQVPGLTQVTSGHPPPQALQATSPIVLRSLTNIRMPIEKSIRDDERALVKVAVVYKQRTVLKKLSESLRGIGLSLSSGNWRSVANAVMKSEPVSRLVIQMVINRLAKECDHLCEQKGFTSILRKNNPADLVSLKWESILKEWQRQSPIFHSMLLAVSKCSSKQSDRKIPAICMAGGILLKQRNMRMLALQQLTGLILFHGDVSKMVRFNYKGQ